MNNKNNIQRRHFLKTIGAASVATATSLSLSGCKSEKKESTAGNTMVEVPTDKMTYRVVPSTGDKVSLLGYGCMRWPLRKKADGTGEEIDQDAVNELVDYAIAHGVNYFDTAPPYVRGWSEAATGIALSKHPRGTYFIATKMSNQRFAGKGLSQRELFNASVEMYHNSLKNLQTDYLDYYLLHSIGGETGIPFYEERFISNGLLNYLLKEREAGRIRNLGFSFHGDVRVFDYALNSDVKWDFVQIQMNYIDWQHASGRNVNAEYLLGELEKRNIPAIIMEPLLGGRLSRLGTEALNILAAIHPEDSAASWAFRYAGTPESVITVLSGMVYMEHLQENIRTFSPLKPIESEEYAALEKVTEIMLNADYIQCNECQYCMPCPYGVDIPNVFGHYNRIISAGKRLQSSNDENYRKARRAYLVGYDRKVPKLRQSSHCIGCETCNPLCPQSIDIPSEMRRIDLYTEQLKQLLDF
ncbi:MAG: aldo/keto reductase [Porphyromonadaceae bacterium]|nr:aldo/keto reductase [Porphyromonadaceae bacterium]